ncbi:unnamed protein product [Echinostoma caproni]|uniref:Uncharacterized protein n=1 Tax=Echinostoma caproni TaxID=27848 RepID=A0A183BBI4_9TREM|nr:unnamed protein product [Echinostoma caproni]
MVRSDRANTSASDGNSAAVPSCLTSTIIQISPNPPPTEALLRLRCPFKLATFNVCTLMRIGQQAGLDRTLETLAIDVCCIEENSHSRLLFHYSIDVNPHQTDQ